MTKPKSRLQWQDPMMANHKRKSRIPIEAVMPEAWMRTPGICPLCGRRLTREERDEGKAETLLGAIICQECAYDVAKWK